MNESSLVYRRHAVGLIGLLLLSVGIYFTFFPPEEGSGNFLHGSCVKSGVVLLIVWLAFPKLHQLPIWSTLAVIATMFLIAFRPGVTASILRAGIVLVPVFFLIWLFKPPAKKAQKAQIASPSRTSRRVKP